MHRLLRDLLSFLSLTLIISFHPLLYGAEPKVEADLSSFSGEGEEAGDQTELKINGVKFTFRWIPAGDFMMGSPAEEEGRSPEEKLHKVTISEGFWLAETETTVAQYSVFRSSKSRGTTVAAETTNWDECANFIDRLNFMKAAPEGWLFRFPTEAEWEYAAKTGSKKSLPDDFAKMSGNADEETSNNLRIKVYEPNSWGLYDMYGNLSEWCSDWYGSYSGKTAIDPTGISDEGKDLLKLRKVVKGGERKSKLEERRPASRRGEQKNVAGIGFRLVLAPSPDSDVKQTGQKKPKKENEPKAKNKKKGRGEGSEPGEAFTLNVKNVPFVFHWIPAGKFMMGSPEGEKGRNVDETLHEVQISRGFWMLETETTQKMWVAVMGTNPSQWKGETLPVEHVDWNDCQKFLQIFNRNLAPNGWEFRLPTEAEWEYACRAGSSRPYVGASLEEMGWSVETGSITREVATKEPNSWGLYDMLGNVCEWCIDVYARDITKLNIDPVVLEPSDDEYRVTRGGSIINNSRYCRAASRDNHLLESPQRHIGFRFVLAPL